MSYVALYRKYRALKFSEIIGQEAIVKTLKNSIKTGNIGHAFLFNGPRGTGKTSVAKIFAKTVNCIQPKDGEMCGKCEACKFLKENDIDIIEIDAASNNGVDEIREIRNNVKLVPTIAKYKVYIIDEVHMLSIGAFNALLKTLEEPPEHVIFILATTEIQKIPLTIISRCQRFDFKKASKKNISKLLLQILKQENKTVPEEAVNLISDISDGGFRDAINLLEQVLSYSSEDITLDDVYSLSGEIPESSTEQLFASVVGREMAKALNIINGFSESGKNFNTVANRLAVLARDININNNVKNYFDNTKTEKLEKYKSLDNKTCNYLAKKFIELTNEIKKSENQKISFEVGILDIMQSLELIKEDNQEIIIKSSDNLIKNPDNFEDIDDEIISREIISVRINNVLTGANKSILKDLKQTLSNISDYVSTKKYNTIVNILLNGNLIVASKKYIMFEYSSSRELNKFLKNLSEIEEFINNILKIKCKAVGISEKEWKELKTEYIKNIKNGVKYELKEEPILKKAAKNSVAAEIFGQEKIDIK